jgi:hypothetical protein
MGIKISVNQLIDEFLKIKALLILLDCNLLYTFITALYPDSIKLSLKLKK